MTRNADSELMAVLNFLDCESGCTSACAVDKGPCDSSVSKGLEMCGRKTRAQNRQASMLSLRTHGEVPSKNGGDRIAYRLVEGQIRTIRRRLEQSQKIEINITDLSVPWVVRHVSWLLNRYRVKLGFSPCRAPQREATRRRRSRAG